MVHSGPLFFLLKSLTLDRQSSPRYNFYKSTNLNNCTFIHLRLIFVYTRLINIILILKNKSMNSKYKSVIREQMNLDVLSNICFTL